MTKAKLKELLEAGSITQEEYDELVEHVEDDEPVDDPKDEPTDDPKDDPEPIDYDKLDKIIQSRVDKQMAAERKKNAELEKKYKRLQKEKLTVDERRQAEMEEKEKEIEEREKALTERQNREHAQKALREAGLDDGSETAFALVDFVMGADEDEIDEKVKNFKELFDKAVTAEVNKRFKENGGKPQKGTTLNGGKNPYMKEQWNITEQMRIAVENPELDKQLRAAAGIKDF